MARAQLAAAMLALGLLLGGCFSETYQRGYIVPEGALEQIPIGSSQEQVLIVLGTPVDGRDRERRGVLLHLPAHRAAPQCASTASSSSATMLVILIIGLTAGPAVSL